MYDKNKLVPGYAGDFVIHEHLADRAGDHWDIRLMFPVINKEALIPYQEHRKKKSPEPEGRNKDFVYRSFVTKKMKIPSGKEKIYLIETEDHPVEYGEWEGVIPEGQYGAGKVSILDRGVFEITDMDYDKKYTILFKGKKLNGTFHLIKYKEGFLLIPSKEKLAFSDFLRSIVKLI